MGKVLVIKGADFSQNAIEQGANIEFSVTNGVATLTFSNAFRCYYTTNGSTPTTSSNLYSAPFNVSANTTIKAILQNKTTGGLSQVFSYYYAGLPVTVGDTTIYSGTSGWLIATGISSRLFNGATANGQIQEITVGATGALYLHVGHLDQNNYFISRASYPFTAVMNTAVDLSAQNIGIRTGEIIMLTTGANYESSRMGQITCQYQITTPSNISEANPSTGVVSDRNDICVTLFAKIQY